MIGNKRYGIPAHFLQKYPKFQQNSLSCSPLELPDVHEDVGHTLVRFLYSGDYETINSPLKEGTSDLAREYRRSVFVYQASRTWGISDLEKLAKPNIESLGKGMPIFDILCTTRDVFSSLPEDETWLPKYIERSFQRLLRPGKIGYGLNGIYSTLGQSHRFDNTVMKIMLNILSHQIVSLENSLEDGKSHLAI